MTATTIRKIVRCLNNPEEEGGFWLPSIQRSFVWSEEQICRLFDSILRQYPIGILLVWKTKSGIRRRKFIDNWKDTLRLSDFYITEDAKKKNLVLDGQQRLQSLFIGLCGSFEGKELFFDIFSGEVTAPDDVKYSFKFLDKTAAPFPWVRFKDLVFNNNTTREIEDEFEAKSGRSFTKEQSNKIRDNIEIVDKFFKSNEVVNYEVLDSIDNPKVYTEDDVVEIFIRANSGGTKLGKSDLLFSLLNASWEEANEKMEVLLESLNTHGFAFNPDFILKTCLVLLRQSAQYQVEKFRRTGVREGIQDRWDNIAESIQDVLDFIRGKTFIQCDKALPTYLVLIPLIYMRYYFPNDFKKAQGIDRYLLRCSLAGAFSGHPDTLIDAIVRKIDELKEFNFKELLNVIRTQGRSLELTEERFWKMGYSSNTIHLLFNLWYRKFNYTPAYDNNLPQVDHIFPESLLRKIKIENHKTGRKDLMKYHGAERNQLANCMLLSRVENGAGGKSDTPPKEWFADKDKRYLKMHLIPNDPSLWEIERFEDFIEERKNLIRKRFNWLLAQS